MSGCSDEAPGQQAEAESCSGIATMSIPVENSPTTCRFPAICRFAGSSEKPIANGVTSSTKVRSGSYHDSIESKMNGRPVKTRTQTSTGSIYELGANDVESVCPVCPGDSTSDS